MFQLGFIVDDLFGEATRWAEVFGVGPFHVLPRMEPACTYRGAASTIDMQIAVAQAGPVQIELIQQYCDRPSVYRDLVAKGESGFHQVCTATNDYDGKAAHYPHVDTSSRARSSSAVNASPTSTPSTTSGSSPRSSRRRRQFLDSLDTISQTCAAWDGSDPVRIVTRDGYRTP